MPAAPWRRDNGTPTSRPRDDRDNRKDRDASNRAAAARAAAAARSDPRAPAVARAAVARLLLVCGSRAERATIGRAEPAEDPRSSVADWLTVLCPLPLLPRSTAGRLLCTRDDFSPMRDDERAEPETRCSTSSRSRSPTTRACARGLRASSRTTGRRSATRAARTPWYAKKTAQ